MSGQKCSDLIIYISTEDCPPLKDILGLFFKKVTKLHTELIFESPFKKFFELYSELSFKKFFELFLE